MSRLPQQRTGFRTARLFTAVLGLFWSALVLVGAAVILGGPAALLRVGSAFPLAGQIERELQIGASSEPIGHDSQFFYAIARDPWGSRGTPRAIAAFDDNGPAYRYRRILYPLLAGAGGLLSPWQTLFGMVAWVIVSFGIIGIAVADLSRHRKSFEPMILALANPGLFIAGCEADPLAVALSLTGLAAVYRSRWTIATIAFLLAALTKETYLLVPASVCGWLFVSGQQRRAINVFLASAVPLALWSIYLSQTMPPGREGQNFGLPFVGLWQSAGIWMAVERSPLEWLSIAVCAFILVRAVATFRRQAGLVRWLVAPWLVIACTASVDVWGKPNNAARVLSLLWPILFVMEGRTPPPVPEPAASAPGRS